MAAKPLDVLLLLLVFVAVNVAIERLTHLPVQSYHEPSLIIGLLQTLGWPLTQIAIAATGALAFYGRLLAPWDNLDAGDKLRVFVVVLAAAIAWPLTTAGYNYYFDQAYAVEKLLLIVLLPLTWWRPLFILPFVAVAYLLLWQLAEPPMGVTELPHKLQVLRALNLFAAAFLVHAVTGNRSNYSFLVLLCCLVAAAYWVPALAKLRLAWLAEDGLQWIPLSAHAHGWLAFLSPERIVEFSRLLTPFDTVMRVFVIAAEGLCLVLLWRRWLCFWLLALVIVFHLGVFAIYGFLFWTWIALDAAVLWLLVRTTGKPGDVDIFNGRTLVISSVLIVLGALWAKPPVLAWYDTPLTYTYRVEATVGQGRTVQLHPLFFAPYDDRFTMAGFAFLVSDRPVLVSSYGVTRDREVLHALKAAGSAADVFEIERTSEDIRFNEARSARLQEFLRQFIRNRATGETGNWIHRLRAPRQFWSHRGEIPDASEISEIVLVEVTTFYDGRELKDIRRVELARIAM